MKASELRIGNIVTDAQSQIIVVDSINDKGVNLWGEISGGWGEEMCRIESDCKFDELRGIPLTEEILLKLGFKVGGYMALEVTHPKYPKLLFALGETFDSVWYNQVERKHVHQLQNLFFALTGEELDVTGLLK